MAKLEIPSIVVHSGSSSAPGSPNMERGRSMRSRMLSKQAEFEEEENRDEVEHESSEVVVGPTRSKSLELPHQKNSLDEAHSPPQRQRQRVKLLVRSHAMREDNSPPPPIESLNPGNRRHKLRRAGSSSNENTSSSLSRDSSTEQYTDNTGIDLEQFIIETLHKNQKDRQMLLRLEHELVTFAKDNKRNSLKFPPMSSYQRMLVHRTAAYFGMDHNVDGTGASVVVSKGKLTRLPDMRFRDQVRDEFLPEEPRRSILKRDDDDGYSFKSSSSVEGLLDSGSQRSSQEEIQWNGDLRPWSSTDSEASSRNTRPGRLSKVESCDSAHMLSPRQRPAVSKSHSFGGYTGGGRSEGITSSYSAGPRLLTKQVLSSDSSSSSASRISPASSGYKSQRSDTGTTLSATPSPCGNPTLPTQNSSQGPSPEACGGAPLMWAISDWNQVPQGAVLINPQTGQPVVNADGSLYRYDPSNPPHLLPVPVCTMPQQGSNQASSSTVMPQVGAQVAPMMYYPQEQRQYMDQSGPIGEVGNQLANMSLSQPIETSSSSSLYLPTPTPYRPPSQQGDQGAGNMYYIAPGQTRYMYVQNNRNPQEAPSTETPPQQQQPQQQGVIPGSISVMGVNSEGTYYYQPYIYTAVPSNSATSPQQPVFPQQPSVPGGGFFPSTGYPPNPATPGATAPSQQYFSSPTVFSMPRPVQMLRSSTPPSPSSCGGKSEGRSRSQEGEYPSYRGFIPQCAVLMPPNPDMRLLPTLRPPLMLTARGNTGQRIGVPLTLSRPPKLRRQRSRKDNTDTG